MASDVLYNEPGAGTRIATDAVGSPANNYQYVKLADGTVGGTDAIVGSAANGLRVDVTRQPISTSLSAGTYGASTSANPIVTVSTACSEVIVQNDPASTVNVIVGGSGGQAIALIPGQMLTIAVNKVELIYAKTASGTATVNWLAKQ